MLEKVTLSNGEHRKGNLRYILCIIETVIKQQQIELFEFSYITITVFFEISKGLVVTHTGHGVKWSSKEVKEY